jgi:hypothetical protein
MATQEQIQQALDDLNARYLKTLQALADALDMLEQNQAPPPEPVNEDELAEAARLMAISDLNKEDLSEAEIYKRLIETSDSEARATGFWAVPLPTADEPKTTPNKRYTTK